LRVKAQRALSSWLDRLRWIIDEGKRQGEIRRSVNSFELATLIVGTLEGSLLVSRLHRQDTARNLACRHLVEYFETSVRAKEFKGRAKDSQARRALQV